MQRVKENEPLIANTDQLISDLSSLLKAFLKLQKAIQNDSAIAAEYEIHSKAQELKECDFSPIFKTQILEPYHRLITQYSNLKARIQEKIGADELAAIEQSVLQANENDKKTLHYFPTYQKIHVMQTQAYKEKNEGEIAGASEKIKSLDEN